MAWTDAFFQRTDGGSKDKPKTESTTPAGGDSSSIPFPKLNIPLLATPSQGNGQSSTTQTVPAPVNSDAVAAEEVTVDPHLEKVVQLVRSRVQTLAGTSYQQFYSVLERMQKKLQPGQALDLSLGCAAINASGRDLASEVSVMEKGLQTAELEVGNEIDTEERNAVSGLESEISILDNSVSSRQSQIESLEQQLQTLRSEQVVDQRALAQKQGQLRQQQATFTASRQRLRAARVRVAQELANQKRTFLGL